MSFKSYSILILTVVGALLWSAPTNGQDLIERLEWHPEEPLNTDSLVVTWSGRLQACMDIDSVWLPPFASQGHFSFWVGPRDGENYPDIYIPWENRFTLLPGQTGRFRFGATLLLVTVDEDGQRQQDVWDSVDNFFFNIQQAETLNYEFHLREGWNVLSLPAAPEPIDYLNHRPRTLSQVFEDLIENNELIMIKDGDGHFCLPSEGFDNLSHFDRRRGYLLKVSRARSITIPGREVSEFPIQLHAGWNLISYHPETELSAREAFRNIEDKLLIAKNGFGNFYIPTAGFNGIPSMKRGEGYFVKVSEDVEFEWFIP